MAGKPFRINQPAATNANARTQPIAPPQGKAVATSTKTGDPLPTPAEGTPGHEATIAWPQPARGVDHKPFKNTK